MSILSISRLWAPIPLSTGATLDRPIFDVSNDNIPYDFVPSGIPADKAAARRQLAVAMSNAAVSITVCPPKEAPKPKQWQPSKRKPANSNRELKSWPLIEKLRRDGRDDLAYFVEVYYGLVALMEANPLQGQDPTRSDGLFYEERSTINSDDVDDAADKDWPSDEVPGGDLERKGIRERVRAPGTASRARLADEKTVTIMRDMSVRFDERALIAQIDNRDTLPRLRRAMGPLVAPFESAVLGGATFGSIGEARHFNGKQAEAAGKVLVMTALEVASNEWLLICRERLKAEDQAERNVERYRAELASRRVAFLNRAA